jgi:hypothetical protein
MPGYDSEGAPGYMETMSYNCHACGKNEIERKVKAHGLKVYVCSKECIPIATCALDDLNRHWELLQGVHGEMTIATRYIGVGATGRTGVLIKKYMSLD